MTRPTDLAPGGSNEPRGRSDAADSERSAADGRNVLGQVLTIARLEVGRATFSRRAAWVFLLALFPAFVFLIGGLDMKQKRARWTAAGLAPAAAMDSLRIGASEADVRAALGAPIEERRQTGRRRPPGAPARPSETLPGAGIPVEPGSLPGQPVPAEPGGAPAGIRPGMADAQPAGSAQVARQDVETVWLVFFDGRRRGTFRFIDGHLEDKSLQPWGQIADAAGSFTRVFREYYLRLAIFFGCLGIFMGLFRTEMLDRTLHYWLLAPMRREVLLAGKFAAGLTATAIIFTAGALLAFGLMLWPHETAEISRYLRETGREAAFWFGATTVLGCVGYGSVFLAALLLLRNPMIPAVVILLWESINTFLPAVLQRLSVLFHLHSLAPAAPWADTGPQGFASLLFSPAPPVSRAVALLSVLGLAAVLLVVSAWAVRRIEIDYGTE